MCTLESKNMYITNSAKPSFPKSSTFRFQELMTSSATGKCEMRSREFLCSASLLSSLLGSKTVFFATCTCIISIMTPLPSLSRLSKSCGIRSCVESCATCANFLIKSSNKSVSTCPSSSSWPSPIVTLLAAKTWYKMLDAYLCKTPSMRSMGFTSSVVRTRESSKDTPTIASMIMTIITESLTTSRPFGVVKSKKIEGDDPLSHALRDTLQVGVATLRMLSLRKGDLKSVRRDWPGMYAGRPSMTTCSS
mmetsp:Transcript_55427/g.179808  ORF Transcript_55427/g.179808 Transcript_55427/m.179808 type:complete len:249 (+) Transcript_55427:404-1150(+)